MLQIVTLSHFELFRIVYKGVEPALFRLESAQLISTDKSCCFIFLRLKLQNPGSNTEILYSVINIYRLQKNV